MSFMKFLLGLWASWVAIRIVRGVMAARVGQKQPDQQIKPDSATLELVACPKCGVYTTAPCTNPNCPGVRA